ncbi:MAG TPA: lipopolysaccharide kinase InaA family protein [Planctomycetota bacterium]
MTAALTLSTDIDGFDRLQLGRRTILVRPDWKGCLEKDLLGDFSSVPDAARKIYAHGRVRHFSYRPEGAPARVFVRRARRGGLLGAVLGGLYAGTGRPLQELRAVQAARAAGVSVPEPLAVIAEESVGPFYRLTIVSREIEGASDLLSLAGTLPPAGKRDLLRRVADEMRRLHEAGVYHADLTMKNILVSADAVYIIDLDKARLRARRDERHDAENLARLNRSIVKLFGGRGAITRTDKIRFLLRYLGRRDRVRELSRLCAQGLWAHRLWWTLSGQS